MFPHFNGTDGGGHLKVDVPAEQLSSGRDGTCLEYGSAAMTVARKSSAGKGTTRTCHRIPQGGFLGEIDLTL